MIFYIAIAGFVYLIFNELEDESVRNTWDKNQQFLNSNLGWKNKWLWIDDKRIPITKKSWKYLWFWTPKFKERFYLSSTMFVFLTDGEHLFQFIKNRAIEVGFLLLGWKVAVAWIIGKSLAQLIKELIKKIS